jgi:hypothetical protein
MSNNRIETLDINVDMLRAAIQEKYEVAALTPQKGFHFHTGRPLT